MMLTIIVRGPPKSGKTTKAAAICELMVRCQERVKLVDDTTTLHPDLAAIKGYNDPEPTVTVITEEG